MSARPRRGAPPARLPLKLLLLAVLLAALLLAPAAAAGASTVSLSVAPAAVSPNGDGTLDTAVITVSLTRAAKVNLTVCAPGGKAVATILRNKPMKAGTRDITWKAMTRAKPLANAEYVLKATARSGKRVWRASATVTVDNVAPTIAFKSQDPPTLFAGGEQRLTLPYTSGDQVPVALELVISKPDGAGAPGTEVARILVPGPKSEGEATWDGREASGGYVAMGGYVATLRATDAAGNAASGAPLELYVFPPAEVRGEVVDAAGAGVAGARVEVVGEGLSTTTDGSGAFAMSACPLGMRTLRAEKPGLPGGSVLASVDLEAKPVTVVLGRSSSRPRARGARDSSSQVTLSGRLTYTGQDGTTILPRAHIRVEIWDKTPFAARFLAAVPTDADGRYLYSYALDAWDERGRRDPYILPVVQAHDLCARVVAPNGQRRTDAAVGDFPDNDQSRTASSTDDSDLRVMWHILGCIISAHDRWIDEAGWARWPIDVVYPAEHGWLDSDADGHYKWRDDRIEIHDVATAWEALAYHEYGHAVMAAAYDAGQDDNAFRAYLDVTNWNSFRRGNRIYNYISTGSYDSFTGPTNAWTAFEEGWAEFFAAHMSGHDLAGGDTFECDYAYSGDNHRRIHQVSRILWDLADDASSDLWYSWVDPGRAGPRLTWLYGPGDDDRLAGLGQGAYGGSLAKMWHVLDAHWPSSVKELKGYLLGHAETMGGAELELDQRSVDRIYYRMGVTDDVQETAPVVRRVIVTGTQRDGAYHGPITVWCGVSDYDTPWPARDVDHLWARFLVKYKTTSGAWTPWQYVAWSLTPTASGPSGAQPIDGVWLKATWDPTTASPVQIVPQPFAAGGGVNAAGFTSYDFSPPTRRYEAVIGAIGFDGLLESAIETSFPITVESSVGDGAKAGTGDEYIRYDWDEGVMNPEGTIELWYKPWYPLIDTRVGGRMAEITFKYGNVSDADGVRAATLTISGGKGTGVNFAVNQNDGGGPGHGTWISLWSGTVLTGERWYHIACQWGSRQMRLYIDGKLEAKDPFTGFPETDWSDGTQSYGAVSLGRFGDLPVPPSWTSFGRYKEFRVSSVQRYDGNFTPAQTFTSDADTDILDHLNGSTIGENHGFTFMVD